MNRTSKFRHKPKMASQLIAHEMSLMADLKQTRKQLKKLLEESEYYKTTLTGLQTAAAEKGETLNVKHAKAYALKVTKNHFAPDGADEEGDEENE